MAVTLVPLNTLFLFAITLGSPIDVGLLVFGFKEYLSLCVDWDRMVIPPSAEAAQDKEKTDSNTKKEETLKDAIGLLIAAAAKSGDSKAVQKDVDADRAGIAMFRIP